MFDLFASFPKDWTGDLFRQQINENDGVKIDGLTAILLFLWEIIPTALVLVYFRRIPTNKDTHCHTFVTSCLTQQQRLWLKANCCIPSLFMFEDSFDDSVEDSAADSAINYTFNGDSDESAYFYGEEHREGVPDGKVGSVGYGTDGDMNGFDTDDEWDDEYRHFSPFYSHTTTQFISPSSPSHPFRAYIQHQEQLNDKDKTTKDDSALINSNHPVYNAI